MKSSIVKNNHENRDELINKIIMNWDNDILIEYAYNSLQRRYRRSKAKFESDWKREMVDNE